VGLRVHIGVGLDEGQAIINVEHRVSAVESQSNVLRISILVSLAVLKVNPVPITARAVHSSDGSQPLNLVRS
jgi:hypothetical protein